MEDWKTPLNEASEAIEKAKAAMATGDVRTMHEVLHHVPDTLTELLRSLWSAIDEMD